MISTAIVHAVAGIICRHNKLLIAQRPEGKPYSGYWEFPGGKIEANETGLAAIKRELHEELGIDVMQAECILEHQHTYPDKIVFLQIFHITHFTGVPHGKENQLLQWTTLAELPSFPLLQGNYALLERLSDTINKLA